MQSRWETGRTPLGRGRAEPGAPEARGDHEEVTSILFASSPSIGFYAAAIALADRLVAPRAQDADDGDHEIGERRDLRREDAEPA